MFRSRLGDVAIDEAAFVDRLLKRTLPVIVAPSLPDAQTLRSLVSGTVIQGRPAAGDAAGVGGQRQAPGVCSDSHRRPCRRDTGPGGPPGVRNQIGLGAQTVSAVLPELVQI